MPDLGIFGLEFEEHYCHILNQPNCKILRENKNA